MSWLEKFVQRIAMVLPWMGVLGALLWIAFQRFPPSGVFEATRISGEPNPWIYDFLPDDRVLKMPEIGVTRIVGDPVYVNVRSPGPYPEAQVDLEFRPIRQPLIEFGATVNGQNALRPLFAEVLSGSKFQASEVQSLPAYVRSSQVGRISLDRDSNRIATWGSTSAVPKLMDQALPELKRTAVNLRGAHDFYVVPVDGTLDFSIRLQAANRSRGGDVAVVRLFQFGEELHRDAVTLSGSRDQRLGPLVTARVSRKDVKPGVVRITVTTNDEVFIRQVETNSSRWVVGPRLVFGDVVGLSTTTAPGIVWTTSRHFQLETFHTEGLQRVQLFNRTGDFVKLTKTHTVARLHRTDVDAAPVKLEAPNGDIRMVGDGYFSFTREAFFEPMPRRLSDATDLDAEGIDAVLTNYQPPQNLEDGWMRATARWTLNPAEGSTRFVLSLPGITDRAGGVDIRRMTVRFFRPAVSLQDWWMILRQELANAWHRL